MLSVMGGLWVMSGSAPLAAQTSTASAERSFSSATVAPGGQVTVTIDATGYGATGSVEETLPAGFTYESSTGADLVTPTGQTVQFILLGGDKSFDYVVTASSTAGSYSFSGTLADDDLLESAVGGESTLTVSGDAVPTDPDPTPEATAEALPPLAIPDLDGLNPAAQMIFSAGMEGNDLTYTAEGANDAKVVVRVSPGAEAIVNIDLGMVDPETGQKVNFSLTDGANLDFQIKKTAYGMAEIVVKEGVTLTAGQYNFQLVVNEFKNAPANTEDVDIEVTVVIDNEPPAFTDRAGKRNGC